MTTQELKKFNELDYNSQIEFIKNNELVKNELKKFNVWQREGKHNWELLFAGENRQDCEDYLAENELEEDYSVQIYANRIKEDNNVFSVWENSSGEIVVDFANGNSICL